MPDQTTQSGRRRLGRELRKAREKTGMTQVAAAAVLGCGQAKINKVETTLVGVSMEELDKLLDAYGVDAEKADELRRLAAEDKQRPRPRSEPRSPAFRELSDLELDATDILCWQREVIPGPLQSELYMLRQFKADNEPPVEVTQLVRAHTARTRVFTVENPPAYRVILSESALHRMPGGRSPELILDQVEHLLDAIERYPQLSLQILTFDALIPFAHGDFVIARFPNDVKPFAYIEYPGGGRIIKDVAPFEEHWSELRDAARCTTDTVQFLQQLAKENKAIYHAQITGGRRP